MAIISLTNSALLNGDLNLFIFLVEGRLKLKHVKGQWEAMQQTPKLLALLEFPNIPKGKIERENRPYPQRLFPLPSIKPTPNPSKREETKP